ncbi:MAG: NAD(P)-dependent alcohol dehydrogenase [Gammaproteobacteria bacterium]
MSKIRAYAAQSANSPLEPFAIDRRDPGSHDVAIEIAFCGICHSDLHQVRDEWGRSHFPMVPGHEIVGQVAATGRDVSRFQAGQWVGVGCFVDSCRHCEACRAGEEQFCADGMTLTYNGFERDQVTPTFGGYSTRIVVDENYVLHLPEALPRERAAPLLCAGITTYSPLKRHGAGPGRRVGVMGLGGLGHMAVKLAKAMGAEVTVLSHSARKQAGALKLGADHFVDTAKADLLKSQSGAYDLILDTVSASHDYNAALDLLRRDGTLVLIGVPPPSPLAAGSLIMKRRHLTGSLIGGIRETQEMLDFCAERGVAPEVEMIPMEKINEAYLRMDRGDVLYRFVIDLASLRKEAA